MRTAVLFLIIIFLSGCTKNRAENLMVSDQLRQPEASDQESDSEEEPVIPVIITIGEMEFAASFYDSEAAQMLVTRMPFQINMSDMNQNEKYFYLEEELPSNQTECPETIREGEIMCWSSNCLVIFYETFSNSYGGYVRLGYIEDAAGLKEAVGAGDISVMFQVPQS